MANRKTLRRRSASFAARPPDSQMRTNVATPGDRPQSPSAWASWQVGLSLLALTILAALLRIPAIHESLWTDELHTSWTVSASFAEVPDRAEMASSTRWYFMLVWPLTRMLGHSEWVLRLPSLVAGALVIPLSFLLAKRLGCTIGMALVAAAVLAIDRHRVHYALEARPYAIVQLVAVIQVLAFWEMIHLPTFWRRSAWIIASAILFHLHYVSVLLVVAEISFVVLSTFLFPEKVAAYSSKRLAADALCIAVLLLPAFPHLNSVALRRSGWESFAPRPPITAIAVIYPIHTYVFLPAALLALLGVERAARSQAIERLYRPLLLCGCWLLLPLSVAWAVDQLAEARLFVRRYLIFNSIAPAMLTGLIGSVAASARHARIIGVAVLCVAAFTLSPINQDYHGLAKHGDSREDWRSAVDYVRRFMPEQNGVVFVRSGLFESDDWYAAEDRKLIEYCLLPVKAMYRLPECKLFPLPRNSTFELSAFQTEAIRSAGGFWLFSSGTEEQLEAAAAQLFRQVESAGGTLQVQASQRFGRVATVQFIFIPDRLPQRQQLEVPGLDSFGLPDLLPGERQRAGE